MPSIAIVSQKGGSGKTTLVLHLATCAAYNGTMACVIDTDPQATAAAWGDWRGNEYQPEVITSPPARLSRTIQKAYGGGAQLVLIDTPPHADAAAREALKVADLILVPTRLRAFDLHALEATAELVRYAGKQAFVLLNAVPAGATTMVTDASEVAEQLGLQLCPIRFGDRAAFHRASWAGGVASEYEPDGKAAAEVGALWQWVCEQLAIPDGG